MLTLPKQTPSIKQQLCGAVLANKPAGMASTMLVSHLRRVLGMKKIGHTGILDRAASGLMLLLVGRATGFADFFLHADKEYIANFSFGISTDTHDKEGTVIQEESTPVVQEFMKENRSQICNLIESWKELTSQKPPIYSALKSKGKRLSDHARSGNIVEAAPRRVKVYKSKVLNYDEVACRVQVALHVSGGTYVRALARDLGEELSMPVNLGDLHRIAVGPHQMKAFDKIWQVDKNKPQLLPAQSVLTHWPCVSVSSLEHARQVWQGKFLPLEFLKGALPSRVQENFFIEDEQGRALAWAVRTTRGYNYKRILV